MAAAPTTRFRPAPLLLLLALVACGGSASTDDGAERIGAAGTFALETEYSGPADPTSAPISAPEDASDVPNVASYVCTTQGWRESQIRDLAGRVALGQGMDTLYPGALLQGKAFSEGRFTPITIPRAGGTVYLTGLKLAPNASYSRVLPTVGAAAVQQAIEDILSVNVQGTAAEASYVVDQAFDQTHLLFSLGVDARYGNAEMSSALSLDKTRKTNKVLVRFTQKFYDVVFEDPELSTSVFRDGASFDDPEAQIAPGSPPVYVKKVTFGRMVFFLAESEYNAEDLQTALQGAYDGLVGSVEVQAGLTLQQVLSKTKITYWVRGGSAGLALAPIAAATPAGMYDAVKNFIANKESADYSAANPGAPIAYTLNYLSTRDVAQMSYTAVYDRADCELLLKPPVQPTYRAFSVYVNSVDDSVKVTLVKGSSTVKTFSTNLYDARTSWDLTPYMSIGSTYRVKIELSNGGCWDSRLYHSLRRDGVAVRSQSYHVGHGLNCGVVHRVQYDVNRSGYWQLIENWGK